jgi:hypothetical protein
MNEEDYWKHPLMWLLLVVMLLMFGVTYLQHLIWKAAGWEILGMADPMDEWKGKKILDAERM